jgi:hypothetical protein
MPETADERRFSRLTVAQVISTFMKNKKTTFLKLRITRTTIIDARQNQGVGIVRKLGKVCREIIAYSVTKRGRALSIPNGTLLVSLVFAGGAGALSNSGGGAG